MKDIYIEVFPIRKGVRVAVFANGEEINILGNEDNIIPKLLRLINPVESNIYLDTRGYGSYLGDVLDKNKISYTELKFKSILDC